MIYEYINTWLSMKSKETQRSYKSIIKEWCETLGASYGLNADFLLKANKESVMKHLQFIRNKQGQKSRYNPEHISSANATVRKKISVLHNLYELLLGERLIDHNPWHSLLITKPKSDRNMKRKTEALAVDEVRRLLSLPDIKKRTGVRDVALLAICLGSGLRIHEALNLLIEDVLIDQVNSSWLLKLRAPKGGGDQVQGLPDWAQEALSLLVAQRRSDTSIVEGNKLFVRYNSKQQAYKPLLYRTAARLLKKYFLQAGLINKSAHSLRKTAITRLASIEPSIVNVRDFARHKSVKTTEHYLDELKKFSSSKKVVY
jgi:integrase/recombinase XerD